MQPKQICFGCVEAVDYKYIIYISIIRAWRGSSYQQDHSHPSKRLYALCFASSMVTARQNYNRGKNDSAMRKFIVAILLERIQWFWGVHLACQIGGSATSSTMNGSAEVNKTIPQRGRAFSDK